MNVLIMMFDCLQRLTSSSVSWITSGSGVLVDPSVGQRYALGLPSVIMTICFMSFVCRARMRCARRSPSRVLVWCGPTLTRGSWLSGISAVSWKSNCVQSGNCVIR